MQRFAASFKVVLLVGARQVGKSTLLQHVFPEVRSVVFDPVQDVYGARHDPDQFLETFGSPMILDEVQYVPELLAAVKRRVDLSPARGQYFMTGSQNLAILKDVSESMAGRVGILRLDGLTPAEVAGKSSTKSWLSSYIDEPEQFADALQEMPVADVKRSLAHYLWRGQLPGVEPFDDSEVPAYWSSYLQTYVERDVRRMSNIADLGQFGRFLRLCGALTGQEIVQSKLGRELGVNPKTARTWVDLLEGSYQWVELPAYSGNRVKRVSGRPKGHISDSGMSCYLNGMPTPESVLSSPLFGSMFESWGVSWVARQVQRLPLAPMLYHWRVHSGAEVDLVLDYNGRLYPVEFKAGTHLTGYDARGIRSFQENFKQATTGVVVYGGRVPFRLSERVVAVPWCAL